MSGWVGGVGGCWVYVLESNQEILDKITIHISLSKDHMNSLLCSGSIIVVKLTVHCRVLLKGFLYAQGYNEIWNHKDLLKQNAVGYFDGGK